RTAASSRFSVSCRFLRKARPPTMFSRPRTKARSLRRICRTGPGIRGRSQGPPASFQPAGTARTTSGARYSCRTGLWQFSRRMTARDMQAWTAVRMIGEGASRTRSADPKVMLDFLKGPDFALAAFKGQRLTLRDWNLQLRQPILLSDGRMIVSVSPQEG